MTAAQRTPEFTFSRWRHGGWYVHEVQYPNGAIGCVSRNFPDGKWRIVCSVDEKTYPSRAAAAAAEKIIADYLTHYSLPDGRDGQAASHLHDCIVDALGESVEQAVAAVYALREQNDQAMCRNTALLTEAYGQRDKLADDITALRNAHHGLLSANTKLREALERIGDIASCAPHDVPDMASREFTRIMQRARAALQSTAGGTTP